MKRIEIDGYVLSRMVVTRDTTQFETSLLNFDAPENAVQIIPIDKKKNKKKKTKY